jgi:hypothetical protein
MPISPAEFIPSPASLPALFDVVGAGADYLAQWLSGLEARLTPQLGAPAAPAAALPP